MHDYTFTLRSQNFDFPSLKNSSPSQFFGKLQLTQIPLNFKSYCCNFRGLGKNRVRLFSAYVPFLRYLIFNKIVYTPFFSCEKTLQNVTDDGKGISKGWSPWSDCKIRSLSMHNMSCYTTPHVFASFARLKKKVQPAWTFFQSLANDDVKVNKTHRIPSKIDLDITLSKYCLNFDEINSTKWNIKGNFRICYGTKLKKNNMENSHCHVWVLSAKIATSRSSLHRKYRAAWRQLSSGRAPYVCNEGP